MMLQPADRVEHVTADLALFSLIACSFSGPSEGRGYSQARMLRQRYRYGAELRARGALKRDQLFFLARCGFDAFELDPSEDPEAALAAFAAFSVATQGGSARVVAPLQRGADGESVHKQLLSLDIPHDYDNDKQHKHGWNSGWIESAVEILLK